MEYLPIISTIVSVLLLGIGFLIKRAIFREIDSLNIRIKDMETEVKSIRSNYLARFDDIKKTVNENHIEQIKMVSELKELIAEQISFCKFHQELKPKRGKSR